MWLGATHRNTTMIDTKWIWARDHNLSLFGTGAVRKLYRIR